MSQNKSIKDTLIESQIPTEKEETIYDPYTQAVTDATENEVQQELSDHEEEYTLDW